LAPVAVAPEGRRRREVSPQVEVAEPEAEAVRAAVVDQVVAAVVVVVV
jgi:hypothetical protein